MAHRIFVSSWSHGIESNVRLPSMLSHPSQNLTETTHPCPRLPFWDNPLYLGIWLFNNMGEVLQVSTHAYFWSLNLKRLIL